MAPSQFRSELARGAGKAVSTLADQALVSLVNFSSFLLLARAMPEAELGHFAIAFAIILLVTALQQSLLGAAYQVKGARLKGTAMKRFTTVIFAMQVVFALATFLLLAAGGGVLWLAGSGYLAFLAAMLSVTVMPWMAQDLMRKVFYTRGLARSALWNDVVCYGLQGGGVVWLVTQPEAPLAWMGVAVYGAASFAAAVFGAFQLRDLVAPALLRARKRVLVVVRQVWSFGRWLFGAQIWTQVGATGHTWIIAILLGPAALGAYRAAAHLVNVFNPIEIAISLWLPPKASQEFAKNGAAGLRSWFRKIVPILMAPTTLGVIAFAFLAEPVLHIVYDGRFDGLGLHWVLALLALSRAIFLGRNLYQTGLVAGDRPDTSLVDSLLAVVLKYGIGIPAVYFLQLYGAPIAALSVAVSTLVYNRQVFKRLGEKRAAALPGGSWLRVGAGAEGVVFRDEAPSVVTKVYRDERAVDDAWNYYSALCAAAEREQPHSVKTPRPISFEPEIPLIRMESCSGRPVVEYLTGNTWTPGKGDEIARRIWLGIRDVTEATGLSTTDLWFNVLYDEESDELSFVDFGAPKENPLFTRAPERTLTAGGVLGFALYELSRPGNCLSLRGNARVRAFCRALWSEAIQAGESPVHLRASTEMIFNLAGFTGSWFRQAWYRTIGSYTFAAHARRVFQGSQSTRGSNSSPMVYHYIVHYPDEGVQTANGVHRAVRGLAIGLTESGAYTEILTERPIRMSRMMPQGIDVHAFRRAPTRIPGGRLPHGLKKYVASLPDRALFVVHGQFSPRATRVALMLKRMGRPFVWMPHSLYSEAVFKKSPLAKWCYWHLFEKKVLEDASLIQILEASQADPLRQRGITTPAAVVPNAVDPDLTIPEERLSWSQEGPIRLYYLGRINFHQKGLDLLVQAVAAIRDEVDVRLVIQGGDAGDGEALRDLVEGLDVGDVVTIRPADFDRTSADLMSEHDVFCMPSRVEGFPIAALDAMQAGRPLLFTNVSGLSHAVLKSDCGVLVAPEVESVVEGLQTLCRRRDEFPAMGRSGQEYVTSRYSRVAVGRIAADAYENVAVARSRSRHHEAAPDRAPEGAERRLDPAMPETGTVD